MWVLIFAMYAAPFAETDFASISSQEFESEATCKMAKKAIESNFTTAKAINSIAVCVKR